MKIVDRKTFLEMPEGILFSKYEPCYFGDIAIKGGTFPEYGDFCHQLIADSIELSGTETLSDKCTMMEHGESVPVDLECQGRDGLYDADQLFAVWESADIEALISRLQKCVGAP